MANMKGKVVIVTGSGQGIGLGIATAFAKEGASLVLTDIAPDRLEEAKKMLQEEHGTQVLAMVADGGNESAVDKVIVETICRFGRIDVLINNAQASKSGKYLETHSKEDFDLAIYSGLYATFFYMKAALPFLKDTQGSVINFASGAGIAGRLGQASYAAAKEGIRGLSRVAANEWGKYGINVNVVCPLVMTPALAKWKEDHPDLYEKTIQDIPLRRFAHPEKDIGRICVFLASEDGSYISGDTISVQGGGGLRP